MSDPLTIQSEKFHAFEWLRCEALKGNKHAGICVVEHARLPRGPSTSRCVSVEELEAAYMEAAGTRHDDAGEAEWGVSRAKRVADGASVCPSCCGARRLPDDAIIPGLYKDCPHCQGTGLKPTFHD